MRIVALIPAAGVGRRMGSGNRQLNKVFYIVNGKPLLYYTLRHFESCSEIEEIVLIVRGGEEDYCRSEIIDRFGIRKIKRIIPGGRERQDSVFNGLQEIKEDGFDLVAIHDGARPLIKEEVILRAIAETIRYKAGVVAVPVKDTIKREDKAGFVQRTIDRKELWAIQTPQIFSFELIYDSYIKAYEDNFYGTDDAMLVERLGHQVKLVMGAYDNLKVTTPDDLVIMETILRGEADESRNRI